MRHSALFLSLIVIGAGFLACSSDDSDGAEDGTSAATAGSGNSPLAEDCDDRCQAKAADCGAPTEIAVSTCNSLCGMDVTEEQAQCLEDSDCSALTATVTGGSICGIGQGPSSSSSTNGSTTTSGPSTTTTSTSTTSDPDTTTPGGTLGDSCDCGNPTLECEGTENGCQFSFSGESYSCLVNSGDTSSGFCTQSCDPDNDTCPDGGSCTEFSSYITMETFYRCQ